MGNKTTSTGMSKLLANASKMEKEIKETENVAPTITTNPELAQKEEGQQEIKEAVKPENVLSEKRIKPSKKMSKRTKKPTEKRSITYYSRKGK